MSYTSNRNPIIIKVRFPLVFLLIDDMQLFLFMKLHHCSKQLYAYKPWIESFKGEYKTEAYEFLENNYLVFTEVFNFSEIRQ